MNARNANEKKIIAWILSLVLVFSAFGTIPQSVQASSTDNAKKVQIIKPKKNVLTLKKGASFNLKAKATPKNLAKKGFVYKSSKKSVASVSKNGKITAKKNGTTKITVSVKGRKKLHDSIKVKVITPVSKITVSGKKEVPLGKTIKLKAKVSPAKAMKSVRWKSHNPKIASVNSKGVVRGLKAGKAKITAYAKDGSKKKASFQVKVKASGLKNIAVTKKPNKTAYIAGESFQPTGMAVTAYYKNGGKNEVKGYTMQPGAGTPLRVSDKEILISYQLGKIKKTTTLPISVTEAKGIQLTEVQANRTIIEVTQGTSEAEVKKLLAGCTLKASATNGATPVLKNQESIWSLTSYDQNSEGTYLAVAHPALPAGYEWAEDYQPATVNVAVALEETEQAEAGMESLTWQEIIDVGGDIGNKVKASMLNYGMDILYDQHLDEIITAFEERSLNGPGWIGEQPGKWLEAMSLSKWMRNSEMNAAIADVTNRLANAQLEADPNAQGYLVIGGYLSNASDEMLNNEKNKNEYNHQSASKPLKGMDAYEMYSTLHGLIGDYEANQQEDAILSETALNTATNLADYIVATVGDNTEKVEGTDLYKQEFYPMGIDGIAGNDVMQGLEGTLLIDPMMRLSLALKDKDPQRAKSYSEWVDWVIQNIDKWSSAYKDKKTGYMPMDTPYADLDKVVSGEMNVGELQTFVHAHTFQMNFLGLLKKYLETGDSSYLEKVSAAWKNINSLQKYITGTVSIEEQIKSDDNLPNSGKVCETCATNTWTKLSHELFLTTGELPYMETIEEVLYNHMWATSTIDSDGYSYHRPLNGSTTDYYEQTNCCSSSGLRMQAYVPYYLYSKSADRVYIDQFVQSEVEIKMPDGIFHLKQDTSYPNTDEIRIIVGDKTSSAADVMIRVPQWVENGTIRINDGKTSALTAGKYVNLHGLKAGDQITLSYPSELEWVKGEKSNEGSYAMKKGPVVYCVHLAYISEDQAYQAFGSKIGSLDLARFINPVGGEKVETKGVIDFSGDARQFGTGYLLDMKTVGGVVTLAAVPYANAGQWYRYGTEKPEDYAAADSFNYCVWMKPGDLDDAYPEPPKIQDEPILHYTFDQEDVEGTVVKDVSGNGNNGQLIGDAQIREDEGVFGDEVYLNGENESSVKLPDGILDDMYEFSIAMWVKPDVFNGARLMHFGASDAENVLQVELRNGGKVVIKGKSQFNSDNKAMTQNEYQHVVLTISGAKAQLWVNGKSVAKMGNFNMSPLQTKGMVQNYLGKIDDQTGSTTLKASIDDFRIYNRHLSDQELQELVAEGHK